MESAAGKLRRISRQLVQEYGREPTSEEIGKGVEIQSDKVREIIKVSQNSASLETPIGGGSKVCYSRLGVAVLAQAVEDEDVDWILSENLDVSMGVSFWCDVAGENIEDFQERCGVLDTKRALTIK